jgi:hypothetical protein
MRRRAWILVLGQLAGASLATAAVEVVSPVDMQEHVPGPNVLVSFLADTSASSCPVVNTLLIDGLPQAPALSGCTGTFTTPPLATCVFSFSVKSTYASGSAVLSPVIQAFVDGLPAPPDMDGDRVPDSCDNCVALGNPYQDDCDGDAVGDACDNCVLYANAAQGDADHDLLGDACEFAWADVAPRGSPNGVIDVGDVVLLLRWATGLDLPMTDEEFHRANVAPFLSDPLDPALVTPIPCPGTGTVDVADVVLTLRASVNLVTFTTPY